MDLKAIINSDNRKEPDILLFILLFILIGTGIAMTYSASAVFAIKHKGNSFYFLNKQLLWFAVGFIALLIFQEIDYRIYAKHTKMMLLVSVILLVLILIPGVGHSVKGSARWIGFGGFRLQPSEFIKVFMVIYLAKVFGSEKKDNQVLQLLIPMVILSVIFLLLLFQPDFGTAVDIMFVAVFILFISGFPLFYILLLSMISVPAFYLIVYQVDYRRMRILAYLDPWKDRFGKGYHIIQSFIAFKKGGIFGVGIGHGTQKISRLPEPHTDFIFSVIAEELGFMGTFFIIMLYLLIFWRGMHISISAPDDFGKLLAVGLSLLIIVQAFINIGVVSGSLPTTGIPLPFISYGGSSLLSNMIAAGILLNISRYGESNEDGFSFKKEVWE